MAATPTNNFDLPKNGYVAFDAMSLRQLIINRLNEQQTFTDQNFLGSNLASIIDIVAYSYHTLIYYLNKTSSESMFTEAQLYENINRIVKLIDYSPIGYQTSTLSFTCSALGPPTGLKQGLYTIPRYSYMYINNIPYSFTNDITFVKTTNETVEDLQELSDQKLLFQGLYQEYPSQIAIGDDNETVILSPGESIIDHFNIDVFVKSKQTQEWELFSPTLNLFLETGSAKKYEIRLNSNKRYEIKFGNNINGVKLQPGDEIAIYYLTSLGAAGEVGSNAITSQIKLNIFNTEQFNAIKEDIFSAQYRFLNNQEINNLVFNNSFNSTLFKNIETPDEIRKAAPAIYRSQYRLVTTQDYEVFIKSNFTNLISDIKCVNNWDYVTTYLKYFYDIGITDPSKTDRALFNQIQYADACNFNNLYLLVVPRSNSTDANYLLPAQKEFIKSSISSRKVITTETVFIDPVYKAVNFGISQSQDLFDPEIDTNFCELELIKKDSSRRDNQAIINDVVNIFVNYFNKNNIILGQVLDTRFLTQSILNIDDIETFFTTRIDDPTLKTEGLSLAIWNPNYPTRDITITTNNTPFTFFEYPFFDNIENITQKIKVITSNNIS